MVGRLYLEHLSDEDLALLARAGEPGRAARPDPERIEALIDSPAVFRTLFGTPGRDPLLRGSPFLLFAVLIHRAARDLAAASFVEEWVSPRQRVPVFDVGGLREFGADPLRRFFLAELLASYTHVTSGSVLVQTTRGWRPLAVLERHLSGLRRRATRRRAAAPPAGTRARRRGPGTRGTSRWDLAARTARPPGLSGGAAGNRPVGGDGRRAG